MLYEILDVSTAPGCVTSNELRAPSRSPASNAARPASQRGETFFCPNRSAEFILNCFLVVRTDATGSKGTGVSLTKTADYWLHAVRRGATAVPEDSTRALPLNPSTTRLLDSWISEISISLIRTRDVRRRRVAREFETRPLFPPPDFPPRGLLTKSHVPFLQPTPAHSRVQNQWRLSHTIQ